MSRSLKFLLLVVLLLAANSLRAEEPPLPKPSRPASDAELKGLKGLFSGSKVSQPQVDSTETTPLAEKPPTEKGEPLPKQPPPLPMPKTVKQASASFATHPISSSNSPSANTIVSPMVSEKTFLKQEPEEPLDDEDEYVDTYKEVHNAMLAKPLVSKKMAKQSDKDTIEGTEEDSGWTNKLVKPELTPVLSVGGSLLIVIAAFFLLAILFRKVSPPGNRPLPKEAFECLGKYYLTQKHQLQVLRLGNRIVLVSVMPDKVSTLAEIIDPDETVAFLGLCRRLDTNSATEMFRKTIANMSEDELSRPHNRPVVTSRRKGQPTGSLDLYSDPDESLASLLARGRR
jgi:flagellar biogenesis protein FliO